MTLMNSFHKTIKFTEEHSREEIIFLDTYVKRDGDSLYTDLYVKETATHSYLLYTSCHPQNCIQKGPYGQFLRIKRNCTKDADFEKHAEDMKKHYADRGYPDYIIQKAYEKARQRDHHEYMAHQPHVRKIVGYHLSWLTTAQPKLDENYQEKLAYFASFASLQRTIPR